MLAVAPAAVATTVTFGTAATVAAVTAPAVATGVTTGMTVVLFAVTTPAVVVTDDEDAVGSSGSMCRSDALIIYVSPNQGTWV